MAATDPGALRAAYDRAPGQTLHLGDALALRPQLVRVARRVVRDPVEAEDCADEAITRLVQTVREGGEVTQTTGWLHRTVIRLATDRARHWLRRNRPDWRAGLRAAARRREGEHRVDSIERGELREAVWGAILDLPARQQEVLVLRQMEGLSFRAIGELLGIRESTARVHVHAARETLRRALQRDWDDATE